jgi:iron complex outermembrane receptor protein
MKRFMGGGLARILTVAMGSYAVIGLASAAQAQSSAGASSQSGAQPSAEIVVTATRRDLAAEKVGVSLTVVGAQELKTLAPKRLEDLQGIAPNVFIGEEVGAPNQSLIFIRGQGYADVEMDQAPPVGVIQDGVPFGTSTGQLASMFDVCSVEVDRGPQGIFYGKNTTAGLINITRCAPTRRYGAEVSAGYGSFNDGFARGVFNAPLGDKGGFKLAAQYHADDGYQKDDFDGKYTGGDHMFALNAVVNYDLTNWLNANLSYDHISESGGGNPVQYGDAVTAKLLGVNSTTDPYFNPETGSPIGLKPWHVDTRPGSVNDTYQNDLLSLTLKAKTAIGDLVSQTTYLNQTDSDDQDYDGTCQFYPGCPAPAASGNLLIGVPLEAIRSQSYKQFTQEERLSGSIGQFDYIVGAFYDHHDFSLRQITDLTVAEFDQHSSQTDDSWSEFGNLDWNPTSTIKLSAGVRNISETKDAKTAVDYYAGGVDVVSVLGQPIYNFDHTWSHVVTRFNAQWQITPESLLYANRSEGFRSGGFSVRGTLSESVPGQANYAPGSNLIGFLPETNVTYEIGAKNHWLGNSLIFNIDGFINDISDFQQTSVIETTGYGPGTNTYVINIPKVEIKGIELELVAKVGRWIPVLEGLTLSGNAGFQSGRITDGKVNGQEFALSAGGNGGPAGSTADLTGTTLARLPADNFTIRGTYVHALGPDDGRLTTTVGYAWIAKYSLGDFNPQTPDFQQSYGLLDASATYNWKNYYVKLSGKNLTNEAYRQFSLPTVFIQSYAPPASVEIEFGAKF